MSDHLIAAASRHMDNEETAADAACQDAAQEAGFSKEQANSCDDGEHQCAHCPWRKQKVSMAQSIKTAIDGVIDAKETLQDKKLALQEALQKMMSKLIQPGMTIKRHQRNTDYWLSRVVTARGNDRGTNTFVIDSEVTIDVCTTHPALSKWQCEAIPISEKTGKKMKGASHGFNSERQTVKLVGAIVMDLIDISADEMLLKVIEAADAN